MKLTLSRTESVDVVSLPDASAKFQAFIERNAYGASDLSRGAGTVWHDRVIVGRISYNGRIWAPDDTEIDPNKPAPELNAAIIALARPVLHGFRQVEGEGQVMLGTLTVFGTDHHVWLIRVATDDDGCQNPVDDPLGHFGNLSIGAEQDAPFYTVEIPGIEGDWALFVYPYMT